MTPVLKTTKIAALVIAAFVPFISTLVFEKKGGRGTLVLEKDNPSGLPEYAKQYEIPVVFK